MRAMVTEPRERGQHQSMLARAVVLPSRQQLVERNLLALETPCGFVAEDG
jgi:hypothetical protein